MSGLYYQSYNKWIQGDYTLSDQDFIYMFNKENPVTDESKQLSSEDLPIVMQQVKGLIVLSQTCDIVKEHLKRPFVEVAPLVTLPESLYNEAIRGKSPRFTVVLNLQSLKIAVDLDRVMTVEKPLLDKWPHSAGFHNGDDARSFSEALARKRIRPAFPNDFNEYITTFNKFIREKHGKKSTEGDLLLKISEIRVLPSPDWNQSKIKVFFYFFLNKFVNVETKRKIDDLIQLQFSKLPKSEKYEADYRVDYYSDVNAEDYRLSERLDYDYLSD